MSDAEVVLTSATSGDDDYTEDEMREKDMQLVRQPTEEPKGFLATLERSKPFQIFIQLVIVANTVVLAMEADSPDEEFWDPYDDTFLAIYTFELAVRLLVYKFKFFCNAEWRWNCFDFVIVFCGLVDEILLTHTDNQSMGKLMMAMRMLRMVRVARAFRLLAYFPALARLTAAMLNSITSVVWVSVFFFFLIFIFAIFVTSVVRQDLTVFQNDTDEVEAWFGSVTSSMTTLAVYLTLDDWSTSARMVNKQYAWMEFVWIWYIVAGAFMILSLLTGLMADKMSQARAEEDEEAKVNPDDVREELESLRPAFSEDLDVLQFTQLVKEPSMQVILEKCNVKVTTDPACEWLFRIFDRDQSGTVSWDECTAAIMDIARNTDSNEALKEVIWMELTLRKMSRLLAKHKGDPVWEEWSQEINDVQSRSASLKTRMAILSSDLQDFFHHFSLGLVRPAVPGMGAE